MLSINKICALPLLSLSILCLLLFNRVFECPNTSSVTKQTRMFNNILMLDANPNLSSAVCLLSLREHIIKYVETI